MDDDGVSRNFAMFVGLAFAITWVAGLVVAAILQPILPESLDRLALLFGKYGPSIAGLVMAFNLSGREGVIGVLRSATNVRANPLWYAAAMLTPPLMFAAAMAIHQARGGAVDWGVAGTLTPLTVLSSLATFTFIGGGFGEELGWRGFALPVLQRHMTAFGSSLILGLAWASWHYPVYLFPGGDESPIWLFTLFVMGATFFMTWLYNSTGGNVLMAVLFHASFNASESLIDGMVSGPDEIIVEKWLVGLYLLLAVVITVVFKPASLSWRSKASWPDSTYSNTA